MAEINNRVATRLGSGLRFHPTTIGPTRKPRPTDKEFVMRISKGELLVALLAGPYSHFKTVGADDWRDPKEKNAGFSLSLKGFCDHRLDESGSLYELAKRHNLGIFNDHRSTDKNNLAQVVWDKSRRAGDPESDAHKWIAAYLSSHRKIPLENYADLLKLGLLRFNHYEEDRMLVYPTLTPQNYRDAVAGNGFTANRIQRIFLNEDGTKHLKGKKHLGSEKAGACGFVIPPLSGSLDSSSTKVFEGLEDALSIRDCYEDHWFLVATDKGGLRKLTEFFGEGGFTSAWVVADHDTDDRAHNTGQAAAWRLGKALSAQGVEVVVKMPSRPKDDANGALQKERLDEWLNSLIEIPEQFRVKASDSGHPPSDLPEWISFNDNGNPRILPAFAAEAFVQEQSGNLIFHQSAWWRWNAKVWEVVDEITVRFEIRNLLCSNKTGHKLTKTATINDVLEQVRLLLATDHEFPGFDAEQDKIVLENGTLDLDKLEFEESHDREDYRTIILNFNFDSKATCPRWLQFLDEVELASDTQARLQEWSGYLLLPTAKLQRCLYFVGEGSNGKSVFLLTLQAMLGEANVSSLEMAELFDRFKVARLRGKLANVATDVETSQVLDARFKKIVAGEPQVAELKFRDAFEFRPFARMLFSANDFVPTRDRSHGFFRRFDVVRFTRIFDESERDLDLQETLLKELPGILLWSLTGFKRLEQNDWHMTRSKAMEQTHTEFKEHVNPLMTFLQDRCDFDHPDDKTAVEDFRYAYVEWCQQNGHHTLSNIGLGKELKRLHPHVTKERHAAGKTRSAFYKGVILN